MFWLQFGCLQKAGLAVQGLRGSLVLRPWVWAENSEPW